MIVSTTRLQLRSIRYLLPFMVQVIRVKAQVRNSPGSAGLELRKTKGLAFWTKTLWESKESLVAFNNSGAHQSGKPKLKAWCDEAVHAHWEYEGERLPTWQQAEEALVKYGRLSMLNHPSPEHKAGKINVT